MSGAAGSNKAIDELLNSERYEGAIESIGWLTGFMDNKFIMLISIVAWFIISVAVLRNVIAGAYAAYPRFWDKIAEYKENLQNSQGRNVGKFNTAVIARFFSFFIPNLKDMSDFHDDNIDPRSYFTVAIPQMILVIMIGVCIYNGYSRKLVTKIAEFGSIIIEKVILDTDPEAIYTTIFETAARPKTDSSSDNSTIGKYTNEVSNNIYAKIISNNTDIKSDSARSDLMRAIEEWVSSELSGFAEYFDEENWRITKSVERVYAEGGPDMSNIANGDKEGVQVTKFAVCEQTSFGYSSVQHMDEPWYIKVVFRFERKANNSSSSSATLNNVQLNVDNGVIQPNATLNKTTIKLNGDTSYLKSTGSIKVNGAAAVLDTSNNTLVINTLLEPNGEQVFTVSGLSYQFAMGDNVFKTFSIRKLHYTGQSGSSITLNDSKVTNIPAWSIGQSPNFEVEKDTTQQKTDNEADPSK